jgi:hypothetical protein
MNGIANTASIGAMACPPMSVSRGVLALQGTGVSVVSVFGGQSQAPKRVIEMDKPRWSWHPAFAHEIAGAFAAAADRRTADLQAASLRNADPRFVIRSRHRSRLR